MFRWLSVFLASVALCACATVKPARPTPEKIEPEVSMEPGPLTPGQGTVTIDVVDGQAHADVIMSESRSRARNTYYGGSVGFGVVYSPYEHANPADPFYRGPSYYNGIYPGGFVYWPGVGVTETEGMQTRFLCDTPCRVNLPYGSYRLKLKLVQSKRVDTDATLIVGEKPSVFRRALTLRDEKPGLQFSGVVLTAMGWLGAATLAPGIAKGVYNIKRGAAIGGTAALVSVGVAGIVMLVKGKSVITPGSQVQWIRDQPAQEPQIPTNPSAPATPAQPVLSPTPKQETTTPAKP